MRIANHTLAVTRPLLDSVAPTHAAASNAVVPNDPTKLKILWILKWPPWGADELVEDGGCGLGTALLGLCTSSNRDHHVAPFQGTGMRLSSLKTRRPLLFPFLASPSRPVKSKHWRSLVWMLRAFLQSKLLNSDQADSNQQLVLAGHPYQCTHRIHAWRWQRSSCPNCILLLYTSPAETPPGAMKRHVFS